MLDEANSAAARAGAAWLAALGLVQAIDEFRFSQTDSDPIPAPGIAALSDEVGLLAIESSNAANTARIALESGERTAISRAAARAGAAARDAECRARAIAQVGLGVAQFAPASDDVDRLERATIAVLAPAGIPGEHAVQADGVTLRSRHKTELVVELAGLMCRMLVNWGGAISVGHGSDGSIDLAVNGTSLRATAAGTRKAGALDAGGWQGSGDSRQKEWTDSIVVADVARLVAATLLDALRLQPAEITAEIHHRDPDGQPSPHRMTGRFRAGS